MKRIYFIFLFIFFLLVVKIYSIEYDLGEIEVIDKRENFYEKIDQQEVFVKIIKIKEEDYSKTIKEILENVTGIKIKSSGGESGFTSVSIRGSGSKNILILIDDIPLNSDGSNNIDLNMLTTSIIDKIEIIKGGNSSKYGSNAMGGVINIITKKEEQDKRKIYFSGNPGYSLKVGIETIFNKNNINSLISNGVVYDKGDFIFLNDNGTIYNKEDDFYDKRTNNSLLKIYSIFKIKINLVEKSFLECGINNSFNNQRINGPKNFTLFFNNAFNQKELFLFNLAYNSGNLNKYITFKTKSNYKFDFYNYQNPDDIFGNKEIVNYLNFFDASFSLMFKEIPYNLLTIESYFVLESLYNSTLIFKPYRISGSISLRDEIIFYNDKIGIVPSIRFYFSNDNYFYPSFNLGFFYSPQEIFKIKFNLSGAYRNPDFFELYYSYGSIVSNKDLKPEKSFGIDLGFIFNIKGLFFECVTFLTYYSDLIRYILSYGYVYKPLNFLATLSYGIETSFIFNPVKFFKLEIEYTLNLLNDIYLLKLRKFFQLPGQPINSASFIMEFLIIFFALGFKVKIEDRINLTESATKYIEPKTIIDIYLKFNFNSKLNIFLFLNNITNIYREDFRGYPLQGFNINMGVNIEI